MAPPWSGDAAPAASLRTSRLLLEDEPGAEAVTGALAWAYLSSMVGGARTRRALVLDGLLVVVMGAMVETQAWGPAPFGDQINGPRWLVALLPLLYALPLWWRRTRPLLVLVLVNAGISLQALVSQHSTEGLHNILAFTVPTYAVARYGSRRRGLLGLAAAAVGFLAFAVEDPNVRSGRAEDVWATAFFVLLTLGAWVAGALVGSRSEAAATSARAEAAERREQTAITEERARVARELHDIVAHNLSVVVVQAAGARAQVEQRDSRQVSATLATIEDRGRDALVEMRRMLELLRTTGQEEALAPAPGLGDLDVLVSQVRTAGLATSLSVTADPGDVPAVVSQSAYRIVQEGLTNALRHAPGSTARVAVAREGETLVLEVTNTPGREAAPPSPGAGYGLTGMRERASLLGGSLEAGAEPGGGFAVRARLPLNAPRT